MQTYICSRIYDEYMALRNPFFKIIYSCSEDKGSIIYAGPSFKLMDSNSNHTLLPSNSFISQRVSSSKHETKAKRQALM